MRALFAAILAALLWVGVATPANATSARIAARGTATVVGDSVAAGQGAVSPDGRITYYDSTCMRSHAAYGEVLGRALGLTVNNVACSGATMPQVMRQIASVKSTDRLVVLVGGANPGFGAIVNCSLSPTGECTNTSPLYLFAQAHLATLPSQLDAAIMAIKAKAPKAKVLVTGYLPELSLSGNPGICSAAGVSSGEVGLANEYLTRLNAIIKKAANNAKVAYNDPMASTSPFMLRNEKDNACSGSATSYVWPPQLDSSGTQLTAEALHPTLIGQGYYLVDGSRALVRTYGSGKLSIENPIGLAA